MTSKNVGRFVWYELMTSDPKGAIAFYSEVVGWKTQPWEGSDYTMWMSEQGPIGGVMQLPDEAKKMGAPPHWISNVEVENVDKTIAKVKELGGKVLSGPNEMPKVGRFAVIADPQGATIAAFQPEQSMTPHDRQKQGEFCWSELLTTDQNAAFDFYSKVFGWEKIAEHDMGPMGVYLLYGKNGEQWGGMFTKPKEMQMPPSFLYYVETSNLDASLERAKKSGAKVLNGPMEVPGGARIVQLLDPQGVAFALHQVKK